MPSGKRDADTGDGRLLSRHQAVGADDAEAAVGKLLDRLQRVCRDLLGLGDNPVGRDRRRTAAEHGGTRGVGAAAVGRVWVSLRRCIPA